jgi:hypothetical protein
VFALAPRSGERDGVRGLLLGTLSSPDPGTASNGNTAVTALSDETVIAVGNQQNDGLGPTPLILRN